MINSCAFLLFPVTCLLFYWWIFMLNMAKVWFEMSYGYFLP